MKRIALTCKHPGKFFHDCVGCDYYDGCDYFQKIKRRKKRPRANVVISLQAPSPPREVK